MSRGGPWRNKTASGRQPSPKRSRSIEPSAPTRRSVACRAPGPVITMRQKATSSPISRASATASLCSQIYWPSTSRARRNDGCSRAIRPTAPRFESRRAEASRNPRSSSPVISAARSSKRPTAWLSSFRSGSVRARAGTPQASAIRSGLAPAARSISAKPFRLALRTRVTIRVPKKQG